MTDVLFTAADIAEMRAFSDANLPHSAAIQQGTRSFEAGGTGGKITWAADPVATEACRLSPASAPQESLTGGSVANVREFYVTMEHAAMVPADTAGTTLYRLAVTHDMSGAPSPLYLYPVGTPVRSYEMLRKILTTTVSPK